MKWTRYPPSTANKHPNLLTRPTVSNLLNPPAMPPVVHPRFQVIRELGRGSLGAVFEAIDSAAPDSRVALKLLTHPHAERLCRFKREFRVLAELRHRNLVQLHELVASGPHVFFTMELLQGESVLTWARGRPERARDVARQVAEGLLALHGAGKLHRDLKPSNVLVEPGGRAVLLDFGLAVDAASCESRYGPPEQCLGLPLQVSSDWYALGAVLFEMLTGRTPFDGPVEAQLDLKCTRDAPRASTFAAVPGELDALCAALLSRDPDARPRGAEVVARLTKPSPR